MLYATYFYNSKIFILNKLVNLFSKDEFSLKKRLLRKKQVSKAFTSLSSFKLDHKNPLRPNKPLSRAF